MKPRYIPFAILASISLILIVLDSSCRSGSKSELKTAASPAAQPSPTPKPEPLIAYLNEGNLWVVKSDGSQKRVLAQSPEGEVIGDFIWSVDGTRIYFSIGLQLFEVVVESGNVANAGGLKTPIGVTLDRLELGRDGKTIVVHTIDADSAPRIFSLITDSNSSRELTVDEYAALVAFRTPVIRNIGDISVSPDGNRILFKSAVGTGEELFVAQSENGSRIQITNLSDLNGFEDSVQSEGGRRMLEAAWSRDGRYVIFTPMQSCSDSGLCYGHLFLTSAWGGVQLQLSSEMMIGVSQEWNSAGNLFVFDDGSKVVLTDTKGSQKTLTEGNHPKWQPVLDHE